MDEGYVLLIPDEANYGNHKSVESAVNGVVTSVRKGFISCDAAANLLGKYGFQV